MTNATMTSQKIQFANNSGNRKEGRKRTRCRLAVLRRREMVNSGPFDGMNSAEVKKEIVAMLEGKSLGKKSVNYKLRDWLFPGNAIGANRSLLYGFQKKLTKRRKNLPNLQKICRRPPFAIPTQTDKFYTPCQSPKTNCRLNSPKLKITNHRGQERAHWQTPQTGSM